MNAPGVLAQCHELRCQLVDNGFEPIPITGKRPVSSGWQKAEVTREWLSDEQANYPAATNTGLRTGKLVALDNDLLSADDACIIGDIVKETLGFTPYQRRGAKPEPMVLYRCKTPIRKITVRARLPGSSDIRTVFEVLGKGQQFVAYGDHPDTKQPYSWEHEFIGDHPANCLFENLPEITLEKIREMVQAIASRLKSLGYTDVSINDAGAERKHQSLLRTTSPIDETMLEKILSFVDPDEPREEWIRTIAGIRAAPLENDADEMKRRTLAHRFSEGKLDRQERYNDAFPPRYVSSEKVDEAFDSLPPKAGGVGFGTLVKKARDKRFNERLQRFDAQLTYGHFASSEIGRTEINRLDNGANVNDSGGFKPEHFFNPWAEYDVPQFPLHVLPEPMQAFIKAKHIETGACISAIAMSALTVASAALTHEAKLFLKPSQQFPVSPRLWTVLVGNPSAKKTPVMEGSAWPLRKFQSEMQARLIQEWQVQQQADEKPQGDGECPRLPQYIVNDLTPEKLVDILAYQDRGVLVFADELAGLVGSLDRYNSGKGAASSRAIWLQAYGGGYYNLLRIGRSTKPVENLSVSILGGIQPERLRELGNLQSDGLLQRFIPVMMSKPDFEANAFDARGFTEWKEIIRKLLNYERFTIELSPEAQAVRMDCAKNLYTLGLGDTEGSAWQGFVGKLNGVWGNCALLLHVLWGHPITEKISPETARRATVLINEFVLPHGLAFYRSLVGTGQTDAKAIGAFLAPWEGTKVTVRDIVRGPRCCRGLPPDEIVKKMASFETGGWLQPVERGPWNREWMVAKGLMERFGQEVEAHVEAARAIQEKIMSSGGSNH